MPKNIFLLSLLIFYTVYSQAMDADTNEIKTRAILIETAQKLFALREAAIDKDYEANCAYQDFFNVCMNENYTINENSKKKLVSFELFDKKNQKIYHEKIVVRNIGKVPQIIDQINQGYVPRAKKKSCILS